MRYVYDGHMADFGLQPRVSFSIFAESPQSNM
jgi:hypothetical protein